MQTTQLYFPIKTNNHNSLSYISECFTAINNWTYFNHGKAEVLVFGPIICLDYYNSL